MISFSSLFPAPSRLGFDNSVTDNSVSLYEGAPTGFCAKVSQSTLVMAALISPDSDGWAPNPLRFISSFRS